MNGKTTKVPTDVYNVTKPVRLELLHRTIIQALKIETRQVSAAPTTNTITRTDDEQIDPGTITVLVAEDNPLNQKVIRRLLESIGFKDITMVWNGKEALDILHTRFFDIVLMDVMMPLMGGIESTQHIRKEVTFLSYIIISYIIHVYLFIYIHAWISGGCTTWSDNWTDSGCL